MPDRPLETVRALSDHARDWVDAIRASHPWARQQLTRFFPERPARVYQLIEQAGFSPGAYRTSWPDLASNLPDDLWAMKHYVQFLEEEVTWPRRFPI